MEVTQLPKAALDMTHRHSEYECVCLTGLCQQQVVQVSVSHSQDVRDDTVTSWEITRGTLIRYSIGFSNTPTK